MKHTRIATATALVATLAAGAIACGNADKADSAAPRPEKTVTVESPEPTEEPTEEETEDPVKDLDEPAEYETDLKLHLTNFKRGTSSSNASPENTPYIRFTLNIDNGSKNRLDMSSIMINCLHGDPGQEAEEVFDFGSGLESTPSTSLLPGKTAKADIACAVPKGETYFQVEVTPDFDSETAIFAGRVPK